MKCVAPLSSILPIWSCWRGGKNGPWDLMGTEVL